MASIMMRLILWCLCHFLLSVLPGAASETVTGMKGDSITFPCHLRSTEDVDDRILTHGSEKAYGVIPDPHFEGRVHKNGSCDLILRDLKTTDAGRYGSKIYYNNGLESIDFFVHVKVNLTGLKDKELEFDDMLREAVSVVHITKAGREEVWRRGKSALTDRLIDRNGRLTIVNFTSSDEGTYIVLNSSGGILVTYTVTESRTESKDTPEDETLHTEPVDDWVRNILALVLVLVLVLAVVPVWVPVLVLVLISVVVLCLVAAFQIVKRRRRNRNRNNKQNLIPLQRQDGVKEPV